MQCPQCLWVNPPGARFCSQCGVPQVGVCGRCGADVPAEANFCASCGEARGGERQPVSARRAVARGGAAASQVADHGERRQLTAMFCDIVNSTPLAERLDPEDLSAVLHAYYDACAEAIARFDGHIARYMGDGLLVYFGYPQAHEDDAVRAVRAGLAILAAMPPLNQRVRAQLPALGDQAVQVRIGIHTGLVVVGGRSDGGEHDVLGNTLHIAARVEGVAAAGSLLISAATRRLVRAFFVLEDLGPQQLKGIAEPVPVFRVVQSNDVQHRPPLGSETGLTPLIGREPEMAVLTQCWTQATRGHGHVVLIGGEAGIGKSRLLHALRERVADVPHTWMEFGGSPYHENSALFPVTGLLQQGLRFARDDSADAKLVKLERALRQAGFELAEVVPLFAELLSLPVPDRYAPLVLSAEAHRRRTLAALSRWVFELARVQPLVLVVEDLHWLDPSTLELLGHLIAQLDVAPVLLVGAYRPIFVPPWSGDHLHQLMLGPLTRQQTADMVRGLVAHHRMEPRLVEQVVAKTDGVPLFVEELTKAVLEAESAAPDPRRDGSDSLRGVAIPATLQDSLTARLDRLGTSRDVAILAAVLGREFPFELLAAVAPYDAPFLEAALERLVRAELLHQRGPLPTATFAFKHSLIQDAAYQLLLKSRRQELHARVARTLAEHFPDRADSEPEVIARHYEEAALFAEAIAYYQHAGERATKRSANAEAIRHLGRGIELLDALPDGPERKQREIILQVMHGAPLQATKGFSDVAVEQAYGRARVLCQEIGEAPQLVQALFGLTAFYQTRGELQVAYDLGRQILGFAQQSGDTAHLVVGHLTVGNPLYWLGRHREALAHLEKAIALYDPATHRSLAYTLGQEPGVIARTFAALALWNVGLNDQALRRSEEAVRLARDSAHALSLAFALGFAGTLHWMRRERERTRACAEELIALSAEQDFPLWHGVGLVQHGWARFERGDGDSAIDEVQRGLAQLASTGAQVGSGQVLAMLADIHRAEGRIDDALGIVDAALTQSAQTANAFFDAELHRLKGEILLQRPAPAIGEAADRFHSALEIARRQNAQSLELRACMSLSRLLRQQRRTAEARAALAEVYGRFHEGFDTADLQAAAALLAELS